MDPVSKSVLRTFQPTVEDAALSNMVCAEYTSLLHENEMRSCAGIGTPSIAVNSNALLPVKGREEAPIMMSMRPASLAVKSKLSRVAAHCWALLLVRIYECLPLLCPKCGHPMRIIAFIQDPPVIEKILHHIGEPTQPPEVSPARAPPQAEMAFAPGTGLGDWPEMDQTAGSGDDGWD